MSKRLEKHFNCPTEFALRVLGGKWKTLILWYLWVRPARYAELRKLMPMLSDKVLSQRLNELVENGLVVRQTNGKLKAEVYTLSARGQSLAGVLRELFLWGRSHADELGVSVGKPFLKAGIPVDSHELMKRASGGAEEQRSISGRRQQRG